ncbi:MAG: DUF475 domain-containing protein [Mycobacteriaceae bacterium]|nr:DUF475 domain-containing protein [Mycobacteriaceae bacterium]
MFLRVFGVSLAVSAAALAAAWLYGGPTAFALAAILGILEVSLSFDNAVVNAGVLRTLSPFWQRIFLTIGVLIAVFGMRLLFPLLLIWVTAGLNPREAFQLALHPPPGDASHFSDGAPSYRTLLNDAHPTIAAFGGAFLLMLFLRFFLAGPKRTWLTWLERPLAALGRVPMVAAAVAGLAVIVAAVWGAPDHKLGAVMIAGTLGMVTYITVDGLGSMFRPDQHSSGAAGLTGKAAFFTFLYLEVLDSSFSFDGVIGSFAITSDPIVIALGLGLIGSMFVRSITVYMVRKGTLSEYAYLEHGAYWAIGVLAVLLLVSIGVHVNEVLTGLAGVALITAAFLSSVVRNRRTHNTADLREARADDRVSA